MADHARLPAVCPPTASEPAPVAVPVVLSPEPFSRAVAYLEQPAGRTLRAVLVDAVRGGSISAEDLSRTVVYVDGVRLAREATLDHVLREGEVVNIVVEPLGGGGGRKDIGQILMTIAVIAVSAWVAGPGGAAALGSQMLARVAAAAVLTLGQAAVAALFAPDAEGKAKANERYALQTASNQYRPWAPFPLALGEVVVAPDFAAKTFTQSVGDDVWLYGILGLHYGPCVVSEMKIGDTLVSSMGAGDFRMKSHLTPGPRAFSIYPNDVDQLDLQEQLEATTGSATPVVRAASAEGERFEFDFFLPAGLHFQKDDGRVITASVTLTVRYRPIDEDGNPTGGGAWAHGLTIPLSSKTKEPWRVMRALALPLGRYEFEIKRSQKPDGNEKRRDEVGITAIRAIAFRKPIADETLSVIEFAVRASALNQGTLAPFTCRLIPVCETWDGAAWGAPGPTSNPAALTRWLLTGPAPARPLEPAEADVRLRAWSDLCTTYDWKAGFYLTDDRRQADVLGLLEQAGRASLYWDGTQMVGSAWVEKPAPRQLFTGSNLRDHRWTIVYPEPVHALRVEFQNIEEGGDPDELYVYADGYAETADPGAGLEAAVLVEALRLEGQKAPERAYRDGRWELGARLHRRRIDTWTADAEHLVSGYGDRVRLAWQRVEGATSSRVRCRRWTGGMVTGLRLAQPVEMIPGESYALDIRLAAEVVVAVPVINAAGAAPVITREIQFAAPREPGSSPKRDDLVAFGVPARISEDVEIIGIEPGEGLTASLTGVRYVAPLLIEGETGPIPPLQTRLSRQRAMNPPAPRLLGVQPDPTGVRVSYAMPPWAGSPITGFAARWRPTPAVGEESGWMPLPALGPNATTLVTPPPRALPIAPGEVEGATLIDVEIRALTESGQSSPVPLLVEGIEVREDPFAPTALTVTPATRPAPDGSSHGVLVVSADPLAAAQGIDLVLEVRRYPPVGAPDPWESAGLALAASNPVGDILGLRAATSYGVRAAWRSGTGWTSAWTAEITAMVPAGSNVAGDTAPITPATVAGTPSLAITTAISPDGTQTSRLYGAWAAAANAASYVVEFDDGTITWQEPAAENAIDEKIVVTGPSYRYRVKALSRTGTLSAAWSAWSAVVAAGGDGDAPGPVTVPLIHPLARRIVLGWLNPADDDFSHVMLYRNTANVAPTVATTPYAARVFGSVFTDTNVSANQIYYYWARTVDRTGNMSPTFTALGSGTPGFIIKGIDVGPTDPDLVTEYGVSALVKNQGALATKNAVNLDSEVNDGLSYKRYGAIEKVKLGTVAENAGTALRLISNPVGNVEIVGNTVTKALGAGWDTSAYSLQSLIGGAYVEFRPLAVDKLVMVGLTDTPAASASYININFALYVQAGGTLAAFESGSPVTLDAVYAAGDLLAVVYDGLFVHYYRNDTLLRSVQTTANRRFYLQVALNSAASAVSDLQFRAPNNAAILGQNVLSSVGTTMTDGTLITSQGTAALLFGQSLWATDVSLTPTIVSGRTQKLNGSGLLDSLASVTARGLNLLTGRTADNLTYLAGGATMESLKPGEPGANVTENRTAALLFNQGTLATRNTALVSQVPNGGGGNLIKDPHLTDEAWHSEGSSGNGRSFSTNAPATAAIGAPKLFAISLTGAPSGQESWHRGGQLPVEGGKRYYLSAGYYLTAGFTGMVRLFAHWFKADGTAASPAVTIINGPDYRTVAAGAAVAGKVGGPAQAPADAATVQFAALRVSASTTLANAGVAYAGNPSIVRIAQMGADGLVYRETGAPLTDALAVTSMGTAALVFAQGALATRSDVRAGLHIKSEAGTLISENRIINDLGVAGGVKNGGIKEFSNGTTAPMSGQPFNVECADGEVVTFSPAYGTAPSIMPQTENLDGLAAAEYYLLTPTTASGSGFTARARRVNPGTSPVYTARVDNNVATVAIAAGGASAERAKALSGVAYDEQYVATVTMSLKGDIVGTDNEVFPPQAIWGAVSVTVALYGRQALGGAWVLMGSAATSSGTDTAVSRTIEITGSVPWTTWNIHADYEYRVVITSGWKDAARYITAFDAVNYTEQTGGGTPANVSALSGGRKIKYLVTPLDG